MSQVLDTPLQKMLVFGLDKHENTRRSVFGTQITQNQQDILYITRGGYRWYYIRPNIESYQSDE